jgi:ferric-dicitrate binding protein FerR (iron transport regulator)
VSPRDRLQYERAAHRWTEAERAAASAKIARHFADMHDRRRANRRGLRVLAALALLLPVGALIVGAVG